MVQSAWNYRDIVEYIDSITYGCDGVSVSDVSLRLQDLRPSFINLLRYKVCKSGNESNAEFGSLSGVKNK